MSDNDPVREQGPETEGERTLGARLKRYFGRLHHGGLVFALIFFCFSMLPSLLPRPWYAQGIISGISLAIGYGIGVLLCKAASWLTELEIPEKYARYAWRAFLVIGPVVTILFSFLGSVWQADVHQLAEMTAPSHFYVPLTLVLAMATALLLLAIGRGIHRLSKWTIGKLDRILPRRVSVAAGVLIVVLLLWWVYSGIFVNSFVTLSNKIYEAHNKTTPAGVVQPTSPLRSGSPDSLVAWDTIGFQGRAFVGRGPGKEQISDFTKREAMDPIRIYVGLDSAPTPADRAALAVQELQRTEAFEREVLVLATPTGTGWLEPPTVDAVEYLHDGNTAIVSQQYSYLPSWISFLVNKEDARDSGRALFDAVFPAWSSLPEETRPRLIAYGLSLGSFGGQAVYSGVNGMRLSLDGALFVGTPNDTELWRDITARRDPGSPQRLPVYENGIAVRFASTNADINEDQGDWQHPRILYLQHASDPVVWFSFDLMFRKPDWLREQRGPDVTPVMRWYPIATFFQVAIDQLFAASVPNGHGHFYSNTIVSAWQAVVPADASLWQEEDIVRLQELINSY